MSGLHVFLLRSFETLAGLLVRVVQGFYPLSRSFAMALHLYGIEIVRKVSTDPDKARGIFEALAAKFK